MQKKIGRSKADALNEVEGEFSAMVVQIAIIADIAKQSKFG